MYYKEHRAFNSRAGCWGSGDDAFQHPQGQGMPKSVFSIYRNFRRRGWPPRLRFADKEAVLGNVTNGLQHDVAFLLHVTRQQLQGGCTGQGQVQRLKG